MPAPASTAARVASHCLGDKSKGYIEPGRVPSRHQGTGCFASGQAERGRCPAWHGCLQQSQAWGIRSCWASVPDILPPAPPQALSYVQPCTAFGDQFIPLCAIP